MINNLAIDFLALYVEHILQINEMASLLIQETLGKDTSSQLYSIEKDFQILRNFTRALMTMDSEERPGFDWKTLLGITEDDELMQVVNEKAHLGKLMLYVLRYFGVGSTLKSFIAQWFFRICDQWRKNHFRHKDLFRIMDHCTHLHLSQISGQERTKVAF